MKITDEILLNIGFEYNNKTGGFELNIVSTNLLSIFKHSITNEYWMYWNNKHPGSVVENITDIINIIYNTGWKDGHNQKQKEIKNVLGL